MFCSKKCKLTKPVLLAKSFICSVAVLGYVGIVAWIMLHGNELFGELNGAMGMVTFLMLFLVSALITSLLVLGGPAYLYFENKKTEGLTLLAYNVMWLIVITLASILIIAS